MCFTYQFMALQHLITLATAQIPQPHCLIPGATYYAPIPQYRNGEHRLSIQTVSEYIFINCFPRRMVVGYVNTYNTLTSSCPLRTWIVAPVAASQIRIVLSPDPLTMRPSDSTSTEDTHYKKDAS